MYNALRVWGLMPEYIPNPMILGIEALIPHQRANTPDHNIENPPLQGGEGSCSASQASRLEIVKPFREG
jgi:hypothetical protein